MRIKTLATQINDETYPIAVACLPGGFVTYPFENVVGAWLVINRLEPRGGDEYNQPGTALENCWMSDLDFEKAYNIVNRKPGATPKNAWYEVEKTFDSEIAAALVPVVEEDDNFIPYNRRTRKNTFRRHLEGHRKS